MFLPTTTRKHDAELPSIAMNEQALKQKQWSALSCLKSQTLRGECELLSHSVTHCNRGITPACTMLAMDCVALPILKSWDMSNQPSGFVITYHVWQKNPNHYMQKPINIVHNFNNYWNSSSSNKETQNQQGTYTFEERSMHCKCWLGKLEARGKRA